MSYSIPHQTIFCSGLVSHWLLGRVSWLCGGACSVGVIVKVCRLQFIDWDLVMFPVDNDFVSLGHILDDEVVHGQWVAFYERLDGEKCICRWGDCWGCISLLTLCRFIWLGWICWLCSKTARGWWLADGTGKIIQGGQGHGSPYPNSAGDLSIPSFWRCSQFD